MSRAAVFVSLVLTACGSSDETASQEAPAVFVAFASHFEGFRRWTHMPAASTNAPKDVHVLGPMTVFVNKVPAAGALTYPTGTVIVKETNDGALVDRQIFAMVKRGGEYNASGAKGWEWFELKNVNDTSVQIAWRGVGPPAGEKYGGDANGGCNGCHGGANDNDFVWSTGLKLAR